MKNKSLFLQLIIFTGMSSIYAGQVVQTGVKKEKLKTSPSSTDKTLSSILADNNLSTNIEIRFIDSFDVMGGCKEGMKARQDLEVKREVLSTELQKEEQKITHTMSEYKGKSSMLSDTAREKEEKKLMRMEREYKNKIQESEEELKIDMQKKTENLARNVDQAVIKVAQTESVDVIVDKMTGRAIYVNERLDFTAQVKNEMNKQYDIKLAQNKKSSDGSALSSTKVSSAQTRTV
jgi:outer membrane protein